MGGWPVGYLHNAVKELNSDLPRTNPDSSRVEDLNIGNSRFQIQRPKPLDHDASASPKSWTSGVGPSRGRDSWHGADQKERGLWWPECSFQSSVFAWCSLHTVAALAVWARAKTKLSYWNDTVIAFFSAANRNKDNANYEQVATPTLPTHFWRQIRSLQKIFHIFAFYIVIQEF